ncbi:MAG: hypothetical protein K2X50_07600 [Gammaproteobacteria bacterium]|nr:hypothetical protein [Gammaproteobacteria bacterium]
MFTPYQNVRIGLVTKHDKNVAIAPVFQNILGAQVVVFDFDTDTLGTFSGEVPRREGPLECVRRKCELGINEGFFSYSLASEGTFGPHPDNPFIPCDHEILYFIDNSRNFHLRSMIFSVETNFDMKTVTHFEELLDFSKKVKFPSHALIVRPNIWENKNDIFKGIQTVEKLEYSYQQAVRISKDHSVRVETDMRAHMNPTRMGVIRKVAEKLAQQLMTACPRCAAPGWGIKRVEKGLRCSCCKFETDWIKAEIMGCVQCSYEVEQPRGDGLECVDPTYCNLCNP